MLIHVVRPGDTLWSIAQRYGVSLDTVVAANRWVDPGNLVCGMRLLIPHPAPLAVAQVERYIVQPGDSLWLIQWRFGVPMETVILANQLTPPYMLRAGEPLLIPMTTAH